jgi:DNA-binding MarR family transcriptional regulator
MSGSGARAGPKDPGESRTGQPRSGLGAALRQAWVGYRRLLDAELAAAGFDDHAIPDGRVLRICSRPGDVTISDIGRQLGITRQGAGKIVAGLAQRGYVTLAASATDRREKIVSATPRATQYLTTKRDARARIERDLRTQIGDETFDSLHLLLNALAGGEQPHMRDYLRERAQTLAAAFYRDE